MKEEETEAGLHHSSLSPSILLQYKQEKVFCGLTTFCLVSLLGRLLPRHEDMGLGWRQLTFKDQHLAWIFVQQQYYIQIPEGFLLVAHSLVALEQRNQVQGKDTFVLLFKTLKPENMVLPWSI